jgi:lipoate-protein ligase A
MLAVLNTPFEKISDKAIATVADRITTVRREAGRSVAVPEVRTLVREGYEAALGVPLQPGELTASERADVATLERERYGAEAWIYQEPAVPDTTGAATVKTPGGLVSVHLTLAGDVIKAVYITGDFFGDETVIMGIERALRWHAAEPARVAATLHALATEGLTLPQLAPPEMAAAVTAAVEAARRHEQDVVARGCFVNP